MGSNPPGPGHTTACVQGQNPEWWCGAQQMLYQEWLWVDSDMKRRANGSRPRQGDESDFEKSLYTSVGLAVLAIVAALAIVWLLAVMVQGNVRRREERRQILSLVGAYDYADDIEQELDAEREERERGHAPMYE